MPRPTVLCLLTALLWALLTGCAPPPTIPPCEEKPKAPLDCETSPKPCEPAVTVHPFLLGDHAWPTAWDVLFISEGFSHAELHDFGLHTKDLAVEMLAGPYFTEEEDARFNFYRVDLPAELADADTPTPGWPLGGCLFDEGLDTPLMLRTRGSRQAIAQAAARAMGIDRFDAVVVVFNGVEGRANAAVNLTLADTPLVLAHELGHALFGLGDEYQELDRCATSFCQQQQVATIAAPSSLPPNLTYDPAGAKWAAHVDGAVEGGARYDRCIYHPTDRCIMGSSGNTFCPVCRAVIDARFVTDYIERLPDAPVLCGAEFFFDDEQLRAVAYASSPTGVEGVGLFIHQLDDLFIDPELGSGAVSLGELWLDYSTRIGEGARTSFAELPMCREDVLPSDYRLATVDLKDLGNAPTRAYLECRFADGTHASVVYELDEQGGRPVFVPVVTP
jgi:hypothetical protein